MIIGITGLLVDSAGNRRVAGAGKDTVADILLVHRHVVKVALADPLKRICQDVYKFTYQQLWGESRYRNEPDRRYLRQAAGSLGWHGNDLNPKDDVYLTPRYALQQLGTEWARKCYADTWVDYGIKVAQSLMSNTGVAYIDHRGAVPRDADVLAASLGLDQEEEIEELEDEFAHYPEKVEHVAFSDVRFFSEVHAIKANGGKIIRVKRSVPGVFCDSFDDNHLSEREVATSEDDTFDYVLDNSSDLATLQLNVLRMFDVLTGRILPFDEAQQDVPPFLRKGQ